VARAMATSGAVEHVGQHLAPRVRAGRAADECDLGDTVAGEGFDGCEERAQVVSHSLGNRPHEVAPARVE
jgi:hypothetical protein